MSVALVSKEDQSKVLTYKSIECYEIILQERNTTTSGCPRIWDSIMCWPPTDSNSTVSLPCPNYIYGFNPHEAATKTCTPEGNWWVHPDRNTSWTNLTLCTSAPLPNEQYQVSEIFLAHVDKIRLMYNIGYGISLVSLLLAVSIMLYFKRLHCPRNMVHINLFMSLILQAIISFVKENVRLHCPRNMVHINLFMSFILRAIISFVKENALVNGVGFPSDVDQPEDGLLLFKEHGSHWACRLLFSLFNYILGANYMWIFAEGIYLHMLITFATFSEKSGVKKLIIFGWGTPVLFVVPWVAVRATLENELCWNTHPTPEYFWLIRGPIVAALGINFIIFLNIIRVLFTKLNAFNTQDAKRYRYRKLAKSTLVLIPLFGVHYIVFIGLPNNVDETTELVKLYYEMFFNSFQGFFVSLLFCFLNGEVQGEFRKKWRRFTLKRGGNMFSRRFTRDTMTSFVSRPRDSIASSEVTNGNVIKKTDKNSNSPALQNGHVKFDNSYYDETDPMIEMITVDTHSGGNCTVNNSANTGRW